MQHPLSLAGMVGSLEKPGPAEITKIKTQADIAMTNVFERIIATGEGILFNNIYYLSMEPMKMD